MGNRCDNSNIIEYKDEVICRRDLIESINYQNAYWILQYIKYVKDDMRKDNVHQRFAQPIYFFLIFLYEEKNDMSIFEVSEKEAEEFMYYLSKKRGKRPVGISVIIYMVGAFYDYLILKGGINQNPFYRVKKLAYLARTKKRTSLTTKFLTDEQIEKIKQLPICYKLYAMFSLTSGAKVEHIRHMKWNQLDFEKRCIVLDKEILYFSEEVSEMLKAERQRRIEKKLNDCGYVFRSDIERNYNKDAPISKSTMSRWCTEIGELIGVSDIRHLDFRHTAIHKFLVASGSVGMTSIILNYPFLNQKAKLFVNDGEKHNELLQEYKDICEL